MELRLGKEVTDTRWLKETEKAVVSLMIIPGGKRGGKCYVSQKEMSEVGAMYSRQSLQNPGRDLALDGLTPFRIASLPSSRFSHGSCGRSGQKSIVVTQNGPPSHPVTSSFLLPLPNAPAVYHILLVYFLQGMYHYLKCLFPFVYLIILKVNPNV